MVLEVALKSVSGSRTLGRVVVDMRGRVLEPGGTSELEALAVVLVEGLGGCSLGPSVVSHILSQQSSI